MKKLIIETPAFAPLPERVGWALFTTVFWMLWVYLWIPLITLGLWWWGIHMFDEYLLPISHIDFSNIQSLITNYFYGIGLLCGALVFWAIIEFIRFRNASQRQAPPDLTSAEMAEYVKITPEKMAQLTSARRLVVHHDENGRFLDAVE